MASGCAGSPAACPPPAGALRARLSGVFDPCSAKGFTCSVVAPRGLITGRPSPAGIIPLARTPAQPGNRLPPVLLGFRLRQPLSQATGCAGFAWLSLPASAQSEPKGSPCAPACRCRGGFLPPGDIRAPCRQTGSAPARRILFPRTQQNLCHFVAFAED